MNPNLTREPAVYALRAGGGFFYVGHTGQNVRTRLWEHRSHARRGHPAPVYEHMRAVGIDAVEIVPLQLLAEGEDAEEVETLWMQRLLLEGHSLHNDMSVDGVTHSNGPSMRTRVSRTKKGRVTWIKGKTGEAAGWTEERRAAQSERIRGINAARRVR